MTSVKKAVIPVAGRGTRFLPATKAVPKELLPLVDKPVVQYIVEEAVASGIEQIIFVINSDKLAVEKHFSHDSELEFFLQEKGKQEALQTISSIADLAEYIFVPQSEPLGLGHAVLQARDVIGDEPFVVLSGDDVIAGGSMPATKELIDCYMQHSGSVVGVIPVLSEHVGRYGIIDPSDEIDSTTRQLQNIVEKPNVDEAPSHYGVGGRWLLTPEIFSILANTPPGNSGEIQLTDAIRTLMQQQPVFSKEYSGTYYDCGNIIEYIKAVIATALSHHTDIREEINAYIRNLDLS